MENKQSAGGPPNEPTSGRKNKSHDERKCKGDPKHCQMKWDCESKGASDMLVGLAKAKMAKTIEALEKDKAELKAKEENLKRDIEKLKKSGRSLALWISGRAEAEVDVRAESKAEEKMDAEDEVVDKEQVTIPKAAPSSAPAARGSG